MTTIFYCIIVVVFILLLIRLVDRAHDDDRAPIPKHVPMGEAHVYTAQEVYDWVVYVTKLTGKGYLEQLAWPVGSKHCFLLGDLNTILDTRGETEMLELFTKIGDLHGLETDIVDAPI